MSAFAALADTRGWGEDYRLNEQLRWVAEVAGDRSARQRSAVSAPDRRKRIDKLFAGMGSIAPSARPFATASSTLGQHSLLMIDTRGQGVWFHAGAAIAEISPLMIDTRSGLSIAETLQHRSIRCKLGIQEITCQTRSLSSPA